MKWFSLTVLFVLFIFSAPAALKASQLTLEESLQLVRAHNPTLKSATLNPEIAAETTRQAKSGYFPRVNASGGYTAQDDAQAFSINGNQAPAQQSSYNHFNLSAEETLYDFGRTSARYRQARALQEASGYEYAALEQEVLLQTVATYYQILATRTLRTAARQEVLQMQDHLQRAEALYEQGVVTRNDVLQAKVQLANSRQLLLFRENELENSWLTLNYLTGRPSETRDTLEDGTIDPPSLPTNPASAVANRPDLLSQRKVIEGSQQEIRQARGEYWPVIFARAAADYEENTYVTEQTIYSATIGFRVNLFDGLATTARHRQAVKTLFRNRSQLNDLEEKSRVEYQTAVNDALIAFQRIKVFLEAIQQGEENLRINQDRYREQVGTATDVIDALTLLTTTRTDYSSAVFDYQVAVARMKKAMGLL